MPNALYYGDNLEILREHIPDESVDLIYLDPPFNSQATYNVLFRAPTGEQSQAQIEAFEDTWHWNATAEQAFDEVMHKRQHRRRRNAAGHAVVSERKRRDGLPHDDGRSAAGTSSRAETTGSLYLHCDPTASHYLKILLDAVFGAERFRNEIIWKRTTAHSDARTMSAVTT